MKSFAGGEEKGYFAQTRRRSWTANPAEALHCGNAGIRKGLGASSRSTGLPPRPAASRFLFLANFPAKNNWRQRGALESVR
jgi:hypothetical protein